MLNVNSAENRTRHWVHVLCEVIFLRLGDSIRTYYQPRCSHPCNMMSATSIVPTEWRAFYLLPLHPRLCSGQSDIFVWRVQAAVVRLHHVVLFSLWNWGKVFFPTQLGHPTMKVCRYYVKLPLFWEKMGSAILIEEPQFAERGRKWLACSTLTHRVTHTFVLA